MTHDCPPCCHTCPDIGGAVMPGCMGTSALASDDRSFSWCTCDVGLPSEATLQTQIALLAARVSELEAHVARIGAVL